MLKCPACGFESPDGAVQCGRCQLSATLFDALREAAGGPESPPSYLRAIGEILAAVDESPSAEPSLSASAAVAYPPRFLGLSAGTSTPAPATAADRPLGLPALPPAGDVPLLLRQLNDYLQLGRRQGLDLNEFGERAREAVLSQDRATLEVLGRDLFVHLAASLTEEYEHVLQRRHELAGLVATSTPDVELESARAALAMGDLAGVQRRLRHIEAELTELEDQWATVQILVTEADLIAQTISELGGDPAPALGPLAEGRRLARAGDRSAAEPVLARATLALWSVLDPLLLPELARLRDAVLSRRSAGGDTTAAVAHLRQLALDLRHRNFAGAIAAFRQLRRAVDSAGPTEPGAPDPVKEAP